MNSLLPSIASLALASSALATLGNTVVGDAYMVSEAGRTYSVLDVYFVSSQADDVVASAYGVSAYKSAWVQQQDRSFAHAGGSSWNPNYTGAAGMAWDSFVTAGMRQQTADAYGENVLALTADPNFTNFNTSNAQRIGVRSNSNGPGWYPGIGAVPASNPYSRVGHYNGQSGPINTAKANAEIVGNGISAGQALDNLFMLARFAIDLTDDVGLQQGDLTMQVRFAITGRNADGSDALGSINAAYRVDQVLQFAVPAPGAVGLVALVGLCGRRRRG
jgi:hypothetical protein